MLWPSFVAQLPTELREHVSGMKSPGVTANQPPPQSSNNRNNQFFMETTETTDSRKNGRWHMDPNIVGECIPGQETKIAVLSGLTSLNAHDHNPTDL